MSEDIQKGPTAPHPEKPPQENADGPKPGSTSPPYPKTVAAAGVVWIVFGCLVLLLGAVIIWSVYSHTGGAPWDGPILVVGGLFITAIFGGFGGGFIFAGIWRVRGSTSDPLRDGAASLLLGLLLVCLATAGFVLWLRGDAVGVNPRYLVLIANTPAYALMGLPLLGAGVLALVGRGQHKRWREAQKARRQREGMDADNPFRK